MWFQRKPKRWLILEIGAHATDPGDAVAVMGGDGGREVGVHVNRPVLHELPVNDVIRMLAGTCEALSNVDGELDCPPPHAALRAVQSASQPRLHDDGTLCAMRLDHGRVRLAMRADITMMDLTMITALSGLFLQVIALDSGLIQNDDVDED